MAAFNMIQQDVADVLHVSRASISQKMSNSVSWTMQDVALLADSFGVSPAALVSPGGSIEILDRNKKVELSGAAEARYFIYSNEGNNVRKINALSDNRRIMSSML